MNVHVLMRVTLRCACTLRCAFTFCLCATFALCCADGGLLIGVPLGVFLCFCPLRLADLRQRQPQTQTKSKNSFHSV